MKRIILSLVLALTAIIAVAQTDSVQIYRFTYEYCDSNVYAKRNYPDIMRLEIQSNGISEFYSKYGQDKAAVNSLNATGISQAELMAQIEKIKSAKTGVGYRIVKNFPEQGKLTMIDKIAMSELYYTEEMTLPEWTLADDEKEICGYKCKQAMAYFLGRHWTAWYTEELPINNGPWKLGGLPGLILEANDADNFFHFTCVGIETTQTVPTRKLDKKLMKCSHKEFDRMEREYYRDRMAFLLNQMSSEGKTITVMDERGNEVKSSPKDDHIFIEKTQDDKR